MTADEKVILERIEGKLESHAQSLEKHVADQGEWEDTVSKTLTAIDRHIRGNGDPGINMRLDRIEQREAGRARLLWVAIATALGALAAVVRGWFTK